MYISAGLDHTCGMVAGGKLMCWGNNAQGQSGVGETIKDEVSAVGAG